MNNDNSVDQSLTDQEILGIRLESTERRCSSTPFTVKSKRARPQLRISKFGKSRSMVQKKVEKLTNNYEIISTLGSGSYASVKLAQDKKTGEKVAIKISRRQSSREKLRNEYEILKVVSNEHIIKPVKYIENDLMDESYLVLEYFEGSDLSQLIDERSLSVEESTKIGTQLASSIMYLHSLGIAHRDIKPENILVNKNMEIKLIDFNIAKRKTGLKTEDQSEKFTSTFLTQISSPLYAAPEIKNNLYTESIDIWGIGIILFSCIFGNLSSLKLQSLGEVEKGAALEDKINSSDRLTKEFKEFLCSTLSQDPELRPSAEEVVSNPNL